MMVRGSGLPNVSKEQLRRIITDPKAAEELVKLAESIGSDLAVETGPKKPLSTSQIRAIFGEVRQIEALWTQDSQAALRRLSLLKPKMRYRAGKEKGKVEDLVDVLEPAVDLVLEPTEGDDHHRRFRHFAEFFEAILAYHKARGGK